MRYDCIKPGPLGDHFRTFFDRYPAFDGAPAILPVAQAYLEAITSDANGEVVYVKGYEEP